MNNHLNSADGIQMLALLTEEAGLNGAKRSDRYPDRRFWGYFCSYWPEELVLAAGFEPLRLMPASIHAIPASLPVYCCSLARGCLSMAERDLFTDLAGTGFAHTCDTMQCLGGIWQDTLGREKTVQSVPPVLLEAPGAGTYYHAELESVLDQISRISGHKPDPSELRQALELCRRIRRLAAGLDQMRHSLPSPLVSALLRAGQVTPRSVYAGALETVLPLLKEQMQSPGHRPKLLVSGAVLENDGLFGMLEDLGGRVVADDTCTGFRHYFDGPGNGNQSDPLPAIVRRHVNMPPCPCRSRGHEYRASHLEQLAGERQAAGAILVIRKYCEPHAWDAVPVAERLRHSGIRTMILELEGADVGGQERTRLQAFLESIR